MTENNGSFPHHELGKMKSISVLTRDNQTVEIPYQELRLIFRNGQLCHYYESPDGNLLMPIARKSTLKNMMAKNGWNKGFPKIEGYYWFYGDPFLNMYHFNKFREYRYKLYLSEVWKNSNGFSYIARGHFFENSIELGFWKYIPTPNLPEV